MPLRQNLYLSVPCDSGPPFSGNVGGRNLVVATSAGGAGDGVTTSAGMFGSNAADNTTVDSSTGQPNILSTQGGSYDPTTNFKCWGWFNSTSMNRLIHQGDYHSDDGESPNWYVYVSSGAAIFTWFGGGGGSITGGSSLDDGNWHLVLVSYDGSTAKLYVDGVLVDSASATIDTSGTGSSVLFFLGESYEDSGGQHIQNQTSGLLDDPNYCKQAATDAEVTALWNGGAGREGPYFGYSLNFSTQPSNTGAAATITPSPAVEILDESGNRDTATTDSITLAIGTNPSGGTLTTGTNPKAATSGLATFNSTSINNAGTGYDLTASATGLAGATSNTFDITAVATFSGWGAIESQPSYRPTKTIYRPY